MHGCDCGLRSCSSRPESDAPDVKITPALFFYQLFANTWYQKNSTRALHPSYPRPVNTPYIPNLSIPPTTPLPHMLPPSKPISPRPINRRRRHHLLPRHPLLRRNRMHGHRRRNLIRHHPPTPTAIPHPPTSPSIHRPRPSVTPKLIPPTAHRPPGRSQGRKHRRPVEPRRRRRQRLWSAKSGGTQPVVHHRAEDRARVGRRRG